MLIRRGTPGGVIYEQTFTGLPTVADLGTGTVSIGGRDWIVQNNGGTNKHQIDANGLVLFGNSSAGNNANASWMGMDLAQLPESPRADGLELWVDVTWSALPSTWANFTGALMGLGHFPEVDPTGQTNWTTGPFVGVDRVEGVQMLKDLVTAGADLIGTALSGSTVPLNQTLMLRAEGMTWRGYYGAGGGSWPKRSNLTFLGHTTSSGERSYAGGAWGPVFYFGIDNNASMTIKKMRILRI